MALLCCAACHSTPPTGQAVPENVAAAMPPTTGDRIWSLETSGGRVQDTTLRFAVAVGRTVILRHSNDRDAIFLILDFPATRDSTHVRDSMVVSVHPIPGQYAFALSYTEKLGVIPRATLAYALYFRTPADAVTAYPSPGRFELRLLAARLDADNKVTFVPGDRPAADMIRFALPTSGTYALVARK